jgi:hypothetical protein
VALAILFQSASSWFWRAAKYAAAGAALVLPVALMRVHLNDPATQAYCVVTTVSIAGILIGAHGFGRRDTVSFRACMAAAAGFVVTFVLALLLLTFQGVSSGLPRYAVLNQVRMNVSPGFGMAL